jgi:hypothetical protein
MKAVAVTGLCGVLCFVAISTSSATPTHSEVDAGTETVIADGGTWDDTKVFDGLHPAVRAKIVKLRERMSAIGRRVYLMSGARPGPLTGSMHNQRLAVDVTIDYMKSVEVAKALTDVGFSCVIAYFDRIGAPCNMAHGDLRGTTLAVGTYASGMRRSLHCPAKAISKTDTCDNGEKSQWEYVARKPER